MTALFNEIEPYAAAWMRNLIAAGHVAPGVVDERSIVDLRATDVDGPGQRHFFAGLAGWSYALRLAGVPDDADIWTGSCPCQPFSGAGRKRGFADARHLWPEWFRLIAECRPAIVLGEQVASPDGRAWFAAVRADLESVGYAVGAADLCAAGIGAPHIRQRLYFVAYADGFDGRLHVPSGESRRANAQAVGRGEVGGMANGESVRRLEGFDEREAAPDHGTRSANDRGACRLVDTGSARGGRDAGANARAEAPSSGARALDRRVGDKSCVAGAARDPWADAEWIPCSDGKSRPAQPGAFPLAHGVPGRVGKLRALGNAIVSEQAATFIRAALQAVAVIP